ncbi:MAG TPA: SAM-dependent methyltransferase [Candidatus Acidoferrales bacterium]|nr:SAM-dependent methyltransferase [Candidatus Acidoferrales bacterium]
MSESAKGPVIRDISDTARWVAYYRALETDRPDALFRDPYARKLAGERGEQIVRSLRGGLRMSWSMIVRTALIDEMLQRTLSSEGVDLVLNLAAGLDTRPYRLPLPAALQWVEVDLPEMIGYKSEMLAQETPRCRLERVSLDLSDEAKRRELFARLDGNCRCAFVITEGLLSYLDDEQVAGLTRDLHACGHFQFWLTDLASPKVRQVMNRYWGKQLRAANAPMKFAPEAGEEFFRPHGWEPAEFRGFFQASRELNRPMPRDWMIRLWAKLMPRRTAKMMKLWRTGTVLFRRA